MKQKKKKPVISCPEKCYQEVCNLFLCFLNKILVLLSIIPSFTPWIILHSVFLLKMISNRPKGWYCSGQNGIRRFCWTSVRCFSQKTATHAKVTKEDNCHDRSNKARQKLQYFSLLSFRSHFHNMLLVTEVSSVQWASRLHYSRILGVYLGAWLLYSPKL